MVYLNTPLEDRTQGGGKHLRVKKAEAGESDAVGSERG